MPQSVSASSGPPVISFAGWQRLLSMGFMGRSGLESGRSSLEAPSLGPAWRAELGFSEDMENPLGGAGFNPQDRAHGSAAALVFEKAGGQPGLKGLLGQEEIPTDLKD